MEKKDRGELKKVNKAARPSKLPPETNTRLVEYTAAVCALGSNVDKNDIQGMRDRFVEYLNITARYGVNIGNMGSYAAIGINKDIASIWRRGEAGKAKQELIQDIDKYCGMYREAAAASGEVNVVWSIFAAKNYDGMRDIQDVTVTPVVNEVRTAAEIADKYRELPE